MKVFIERRAKPYSLVRDILSSGKPYEIRELEDGHNIPTEEEALYLILYQGSFLKKCPGTKAYLCCGYLIFHFGEGCPLGCSYCVLQGYLNRPGLKIWANLIEDGLPRLKAFLIEKKQQKELVRIGTGEFTDSLIFDPIVGLTRRLIELWQDVDPYAVIEFKTKTAPGERFYSGLPPDRRIIWAWSINTEKIIKEEEKRTSTLSARLESAQLAIKYGFSVAFHFDPIILYAGAEEDYANLLQEVLSRFPWSKIAWISLGTLRFPPELKEAAKRNFSSSKIYAEEFVRGLDQKFRYFVERRIQVYRAMLKGLKVLPPEVPLYFCMEGRRIWQEVFGLPFQTTEEVKKLLDHYALKTCFS